MQLAPGAVTGSTEYTGDLPGWIQNVVMPRLRNMAGGDDKLLQSLLLAGLAAGMAALGTAVAGGVLLSFVGTGGLLIAWLTALGVAASTAWLAFGHDWRGIPSALYESYKRVWSVEGMKAIFADIKVGIDGFAGNLKVVGAAQAAPPQVAAIMAPVRMPYTARIVRLWGAVYRWAAVAAFLLATLLFGLACLPKLAGCLMQFPAPRVAEATTCSLGVAISPDMVRTRGLVEMHQVDIRTPAAISL
jgi:hypothetical protein